MHDRSSWLRSEPLIRPTPSAMLCPGGAKAGSSWPEPRCGARTACGSWPSGRPRSPWLVRLSRSCREKAWRARDSSSCPRDKGRAWRASMFSRQGIPFRTRGGSKRPARSRATLRGRTVVTGFSCCCREGHRRSFLRRLPASTWKTRLQRHASCWRRARPSRRSIPSASIFPDSRGGAWLPLQLLLPWRR